MQGVNWRRKSVLEHITSTNKIFVRISLLVTLLFNARRYPKSNHFDASRVSSDYFGFFHIFLPGGEGKSNQRGVGKSTVLRRYSATSHMYYTYARVYIYLYIQTHTKTNIYTSYTHTHTSLVFQHARIYSPPSFAFSMHVIAGLLSHEHFEHALCSSCHLRVARFFKNSRP